MGPDNTLLVLLLVLGIGLVLPEFFKRLRIPFLSIIIIAGAIMGPHGFDVVSGDATLTFLGFLGMTFLMFMAGLETNMTSMSKSRGKVGMMAFLNGTIPFLTGLFITRFFGYSWATSILVGIVFISSSVALIVSSLHENKSLKKDTAQLILSAVMITDIISLIALGFIFQSIEPITVLPLPIYFSVLFLSILVLFKLVPKISDKVLSSQFSTEEGHERGLRYIIIILVAALVFFSYLGAHPILAAFLAGLALSKPLAHKKTKLIRSKFHTLGYGLFIPIFFFIVGMEMDLSIFSSFGSGNMVMISLIVGLVLAKFISGFVAGKVVGFNDSESSFYGSISMVQLTTTLAVTYAASGIGILDTTLTTAIITLSIITTLVGPIVGSLFLRK